MYKNKLFYKCNITLLEYYLIKSNNKIVIKLIS